MKKCFAKVIEILPKCVKRHIMKYRLTRLYDEAVEGAEKKHKELGTRVYVVPDHKGMLTLITKDGFKWAKRKNVINSRMTMTDLKALAVYYTARDSFENDPLEPAEREARREDFIYWWLESSGLM